jgi:hypothetical protein
LLENGFFVEQASDLHKTSKFGWALLPERKLDEVPQGLKPIIQFPPECRAKALLHQLQAFNEDVPASGLSGVS